MNGKSIALLTACSQILVVDDVEDNRFLLQTLLQAEGYRVDTAIDGYTALRKIAAKPPDLVLLDVMMPGINGYEVVRRIRRDQHLPFIPILLITGYDRPTPDELNLPVQGHFSKPFEINTLLNGVKTAIQQRSELKLSAQVKLSA